MTKVKICGLRRREDIEAVNRLKPEYIGFVFYEKSRRNVTEEEAMALRKALDPDIISVGVFVDAEPELILRLVKKGIISVAQLHGHETEEYIEKLKKEMEKDRVESDDGSRERGAKISSMPEDDIKVREAEPEHEKGFEYEKGFEHGKDFEHIKGFEHEKEFKVMKAFLIRSEKDLQAARETKADYILFDNGLGSGETFNWEILKDFRKPYFLAGGLTDANVTGAIQRLSPYAVDISSGVETDGYKDPDKIKSFIDAVRRKNYV
ncbi:MAG: phosphoribosylanthranilate isomerase [Lachnospiraceae bacterium]|nr:phosphoribosylanthranilate isomerase [Lachnospiraceae bacterium]